MDAVWLILLIAGVVVMVYASARLRAQSRAGWEDVFTPVHGNEELAINFRSNLAGHGIDSRTRYPGVAGGPGIGMSGASEVWVSVRHEDVAEARKVLAEVLAARHDNDKKQGESN